jgi:hypothetical protein
LVLLIECARPCFNLQNGIIELCKVVNLEGWLREPDHDLSKLVNLVDLGREGGVGASDLHVLACPRRKFLIQLLGYILTTKLLLGPIEQPLDQKLLFVHVDGVGSPIHDHVEILSDLERLFDCIFDLSENGISCALLSTVGWG